MLTPSTTFSMFPVQLFGFNFIIGSMVSSVSDGIDLTLNYMVCFTEIDPCRNLSCLECCLSKKFGFQGSKDERCFCGEKFLIASNKSNCEVICTPSLELHECKGVLNEIIFKDIDKCSGIDSPCAKNAYCVNLVGGYECHCDKEFVGHPYVGCIEYKLLIVIVVGSIALFIVANLSCLIYHKCNCFRNSLTFIKTRKKEDLKQTNAGDEDYDFYKCFTFGRVNGNDCGLTLSNEFEKIRKMTNDSMSVGKNAAKEMNRFANIVPYDHNRVVLKEKGINGHDYINASHIEVNGSQMFIACQGPTFATVCDFWQMIVEQDVSDIIMLTQTVEDNKIKCFQYWHDEYKITFGKYTVTLESAVEFEDYIRRELTISKDSPKITSKLVTQWHYYSWPDLVVPINLESFMKFHEIAMKQANRESKVVVHCCSGVGRTGCFIAIDMLLEEATRCGTVDVVASVSKLMDQRPYIIESAIQYNFIHCALRYSTLQSKTSILTDVFHSNFLAMKDGSNLDDEFQRLTDEIEFIKKRGEMKSKPIEQWIYPFMGFAAGSHHHIACYPNSENVTDFWKFCFQSKCLVVLVDNDKNMDQRFLPTVTNPLMLTTNNYRVVPKEFKDVKIGTSLEFCLQKIKEDVNLYENKGPEIIEVILNVLNFCSYGDLFTSREFVKMAKERIDSLNQNRRFKNLFVLSPENSPLASYFIACCDLIDQLSSRNYVDVYRTVLELKRTPMGDHITLDHYKKLYNFVDKHITKDITNI